MKGSRRTSQKKSSSKRKGFESRLARDEIPERLPALQDQLTQRIIMRYLTTAQFTGSFSVSYTNLLDAWYIATSPTTAFQLFDFVRIKKVTIRGIGGARALAVGLVGAAPCATIGIEYPGLTLGALGNGKQKSDTQLGSTVPAIVSLRPDPLSQAAQFSGGGGNTAFIVRGVDQDNNALPGLVIDVELVYRNSGDVTPAAIGSARAAMTTGEIYFNGLDGLPDVTTRARSAFIPRI